MAYLFLVRERWYAVRTLRENRANYRRCYVPGGSFFFTVVTERRAAILANDLARDYLRVPFRNCQRGRAD
jgi:hypothetical protein